MGTIPNNLQRGIASFFIACLLSTGECLQLACLMAAHGYFFPIDDHVLTVKADGTYYRFQVRQSIDLSIFLNLHNAQPPVVCFYFLNLLLDLQTPYYWPSNSWEPENTDYGELFFLFC